jgi:hypothetical protein
VGSVLGDIASGGFGTPLVAATVLVGIADMASGQHDVYRFYRSRGSL